MYYLDGRWRRQSLVYFGKPQDSSANVAAGHREVRSSPSQEMSYRSHWTISEPNDARLGRVSRNCKSNKTGSHLTHAAAAMPLTDPANAK